MEVLIHTPYSETLVGRLASIVSKLMFFLLPNMIQADIYTKGKLPKDVHSIVIPPDGMLYTLTWGGTFRGTLLCAILGKRMKE